MTPEQRRREQKEHEERITKKLMEGLQHLTADDFRQWKEKYEDARYTEKQFKETVKGFGGIDVDTTGTTD